jgi:hypothetical protein
VLALALGGGVLGALDALGDALAVADELCPVASLP